MAATRHVREVPSTLPWYRAIDVEWRMRVLGPLRRRFGSRPQRPAQPFNGHDVLERLAALPISTWTYDFEPGVEHLGPMAQDFAAAFGLGSTNRMINMVDASGVSMVAVQALYRRVQALEAEVAALRAPNSQ